MKTAQYELGGNMLQSFINTPLSRHQELVIVLAMLKTLDDNDPKSKKEKTRLISLADDYFEALPDLELEVIKASADKLISAGFPNITEEGLMDHLETVTKDLTP